MNQNVTIFEYQQKFNDSRSFYLGVKSSGWDHVANTMVPVGSYWCCCCNPDLENALTTTWQYFIKYRVHGNKTHAFLKGFLTEDDLEVVKSFNSSLIEKSYYLNKKNWWRSDKIEIGSNPYNADISSRNWILNEVNLLPLHHD